MNRNKEIFRCEFCGGISNLEVHHLKFRSQGGGNEDYNLAVLCNKCHGELHQRRKQKIRWAEEKMKINKMMYAVKEKVFEIIFGESDKEKVNCFCNVYKGLIDPDNIMSNDLRVLFDNRTYAAPEYVSLEIIEDIYTFWDGEEESFSLADLLASSCEQMMEDYERDNWKYLYFSWEENYSESI